MYAQNQQIRKPNNLRLRLQENQRAYAQ
jgi:hypothetical protein